MRKDQETGPMTAQPMAPGAKIIQFARKPKACRRGPEIVDPLRRLEDEDEDRRTLQNLAAAVIIVALVAAGFWLIDHLRSSARIEACLEAGHRNCLPKPEHAP
jgi:hypothetical protein